MLWTHFTFHQFCHLLSGPPQLLATLWRCFPRGRKQVFYWWLMRCCYRVEHLLRTTQGDCLCETQFGGKKERRRAGAGWYWNPSEDHSNLGEPAPHQLFPGSLGILSGLSLKHAKQISATSFRTRKVAHSHGPFLAVPSSLRPVCPKFQGPLLFHSIPF